MTKEKFDRKLANGSKLKSEVTENPKKSGAFKKQFKQYFSFKVVREKRGVHTLTHGE